jgi:DNA repair exonuclease SbcCD ATPase subunit
MTDKQGVPSLQEVINRFGESVEKLDKLSLAASRLEDEAGRQASAVKSIEDARREHTRASETLADTATELKNVAVEIRSLTESVGRFIDASDNNVLLERVSSVEKLCKDISESLSSESENRISAMAKMTEDVSTRIDAVFASLPNRWKR